MDCTTKKNGAVIVFLAIALMAILAMKAIVFLAASINQLIRRFAKPIAKPVIDLSVYDPIFQLL